jgi:CDP-diacylglycerol---glycerol-3-phosphate 3-phosphatidyltransferase
MSENSTNLDTIRRHLRIPVGFIAKFLDKASSGKIKPNHITLIAVIAHVLIAYLIATRHPIWASGLLIIFIWFDALDGELARLQNSESTSGMLLDSITDRVKEIMLYIGIAYFFVVLEQPYVAVWAVAATGISVLISYINAWGETVMSRLSDANYVNRRFRTGLMSFDIRMLLVTAGLITSLLPEMLILITFLGAHTAIVRLVVLLRIVK